MFPPLLTRAALAAALLATAVVPVPSVAAQGTPIGFEEEFALATDRAAVLEQLIPGTQDYYYYHCLHHQNAGAFDEVGPLLELWIQRHGRDGRVEEIENRQALLTFGQSPEETWDHLRERLGLRFDHQRQIPGQKPDLPTRLDPELLSRGALTRRALQRHPGTLDGFRDSAFEFLVAADLDADHLHGLLARLKRPDVPNLPALVVRDLEHEDSRGFGSQEIHRHLLLDQLEECTRLRPELLQSTAFVEIYLVRLLPGAIGTWPEVNWNHDAVARERWFERLESFANRLPPAHNSLKANVLYHRLAHDRALGVHDKTRFLSYLRLPRPTSYGNPDHLRRRSRADQVVDLGRGYPALMPPIRDDESLVRASLMHYFRGEDSWEPYAEFVREDYLRRLFAETKILHGLGDMEQWYSLLDDPAYYERLRQRVEIEFAPTQPRDFGAGDPVTLDVDLKNVGTLLVKVFEINAYNFYREQGREVDASIDLDGLVASEETTHDFEQNPLRRFRQRFEFPSLDRPGVFVIELIGNGRSSRAVVRKGRLHFVERTGAAGQVFRVLDGVGRHVPEASIWMAGHEYQADEDGEIAVPFSTEPGMQNIVLRHGELSTLEQFEHRAESYELRAAIHLDREALLSRRTTKILVRPTLLVSGHAASLELLEQPTLTITSVDHQGIAASQDVRNFELFGDRESVHEVQVPEGLFTLTVALSGKVRNMSQGEEVALASAPRLFQVNLIDSSAQTSCPVLGRTREGYVLDVLGKNGEPRADRAVQLQLQHRDFTDAVAVTLKTDERGRIHLGRLEGITTLHASGFPGGTGSWELRSRARTYPQRLQGAVGQVLRLPYQGRADRIRRAVASLLELRGSAFARDRFDHLAIEGGFVELRELPAGDYDLWLKEVDRHVAVTITAGEARDGWIVGQHRMLEAAGGSLLHVTAVEESADAVEIRLAHASDQARVHVVATRYLAPFDPFGSLVAPPDGVVQIAPIHHPSSTYHSGREIGDEYRYILERRYAKKYPGNMLSRPGIILNPWALEETDTSIGADGRAGGEFGEPSGDTRARTEAEGRWQEQQIAPGPGTFPNLDFLPEPSVVLENLRPDADGVVRVPRADLGPGHLVHVVAVDLDQTVYATHVLAEEALEPADRRLALALDSERHYTEQRRIEFVDSGQAAVVEDLATSTLEPYDSLAAVFQLFVTLSGDPDLQRFAFVLRWPELTTEEKRELYSEHACHELHLFVYEKDPEFFAEVVRPYLANKMDKTFLDHWLLGADLTRYLDPWAFGRLNVVERILLARRLEGRADATARHVRELVELLPPDPVRERFRFESALRTSSLTATDDFGVVLDRLGEVARGEPDSAGFLTGRGRRRGVETQETRYKGLPRDALADLEDAPVEAEGIAEIAGKKLEEKNKDVQLRAGLRMLYRAPARTRQYVEHNYWHRRIHEQVAGLIPANAFWEDFARSRDEQPFFSAHLAEATGSFAEMLLALAVLDLPFEGGDHETEVDGSRLTLRAASPLLLVRKEIEEATLAADAPPLLVRQGLFRLDDRYRFEGNQRFDKFVTGEFLTDVVYGAQVVLTNPTSSPQRLELLLQIPRGAIPVQGGFFTRGVDVELGPSSTTTVEYSFYFPQSGEFSHFPVHVARNGELVAFAEPRALEVVVEPTTVDTASWEHVSQSGTVQEVVAFLDTASLPRLELGKIAWRMRDRDLFATVIERLRRRHVYDSTLWSYGLYHGDVAAAREFLRHQDGFLTRCGRALTSPLVTIDPVERHAYQHVEYEPLFNPRAHRFGQQREILNGSLAGQYLALLDILACRPRLDAEDWMSITYYLLLQDRIEGALEAFARVDAGQLPMRLQYDYMQAYLDFFTDDHALARSVAERYLDHPVARWRARFRDVLHQLDEAEGEGVATSDPDDRTQAQTALAETGPSLELEVEDRRVVVRYRNLARCEISYYEMDIEFLFSTSPFVQQGAGSFSYVRPNRTEILTLPAGRNEVAFELPEALHSANVLVEARGGGQTRRQAYYANALSVQMIENYGQLKVTHAETGEPVPAVYVKVFARTPAGQVRFHKDGYTDLRGRFDYVSLSGEGALDVELYAVLVLSETDGAEIREARPPKE